jgi:hypothetical protein
MSKLNEAESPEHIRLVKALIDYLKNQGFEITCADRDGYNPCPETEGRIPDVRAYNREKEFNVIGEAKTYDDFSNDRTKEQFKIFSNREMGEGKSKGTTVPFCIAITKGSEQQLEDCLKEIGLDQKKNIYRLPF